MAKESCLMIKKSKNLERMMTRSSTSDASQNNFNYNIEHRDVWK
jgi:hypothetical protein